MTTPVFSLAYEEGEVVYMKDSPDSKMQIVGWRVTKRVNRPIEIWYICTPVNPQLGGYYECEIRDYYLKSSRAS